MDEVEVDRRAAYHSSLATSLWICSMVLAVSSLRRVTHPLSLISIKSCNMNLSRLDIRVVPSNYDNKINVFPNTRQSLDVF